MNKRTRRRREEIEWHDKRKRDTKMTLRLSELKRGKWNKSKKVKVCRKEKQLKLKRDHGLRVLT